MSPNFFKQEKGLLIVPDNVQKYHVSWSLDNVICGFKKFFEDNRRWPLDEDMRLNPYLPNIKTLQRKFGGIKKVRLLMGLDVVDYSRGEARSRSAKDIGKRGFYSEEKLYSTLVKIFHEPYVHSQARIVINHLSWNVDFLVYYNNGKFAVDVFYPTDAYCRFTNNLSMKYQIYKQFPYVLFLVVADTNITEEEISRFLDSKKRVNLNNKIYTLTYESFLKQLNNFKPLEDPYIH